MVIVVNLVYVEISMLIYMLIKVCLLSMFVLTMYIRCIKYLVASDDLCHLLKPFANSFGAD